VITAKARHPIAPDSVPVAFSADCVRELARTSKLPGETDLQRLVEGVREAARIYASEARSPSSNDVHSEIAAPRRGDSNMTSSQV
jgi:hypothetical protein